MVHARNLLQKMKEASGAQYMGTLSIVSLALVLNSPEGRGCLLKEKRRGQSAAAGCRAHLYTRKGVWEVRGSLRS